MCLDERIENSQRSNCQNTKRILMSRDKGRRTTSTGPLTFDYNSAETLGWSQDMISEATKRMHNMSVEYTNKSGICCPHCETYTIRPKGGFPCEQGKDIKEFARELLSIAPRIGFTNQDDSDARDELYTLAKKYLK